MTDSLQRIVAELREWKSDHTDAFADRLERLSAAEQKVTEFDPSALEKMQRPDWGVFVQSLGEPAAWRYKLNAEYPHQQWIITDKFPDHLDFQMAGKWTVQPLFYIQTTLAAACESQKSDVGGDGV